MPTTAALQASIAAGANQTGGITAADGNTCQLSGVSTVGWAMQRFEIYSFPVGFALPAGWSLDAVTGAYYYAASATCPIFTMTPWGKYLFRLTVGVSALGLGLDRDGNPDPALVDNTCAVRIASPAGLHDLAWNETTQFSTPKKWVADQAANLRILNSGLGAGTVPDTRTLTAGAGMTGGGTLAADRTFNVIANADGSIVVNANDIQLNTAYTALLNGATSSPTADTLAKRGATGELLGAWFINAAALAQGTASGLLRAPRAAIVAAARAVSGVADHTLIETDGADGILFGDLVTTAKIALKMKAAGLFTLVANTSKIIAGSAVGVALFGDVDAGGGTGVFTLHDASTPPTTPPTEGALIHSDKGALHVATVGGIKTTLNAKGDGPGAIPTRVEYEERVGNLSTTTASPSVILTIAIPADFMAIEIDLSVIGYRVDTAFYARRIARARRAASGVVNVELLDHGIADTNNFGAGTAVTAAASTNNLTISVQGPTVAAPVGWIAAARVTYFKP